MSEPHNKTLAPCGTRAARRRHKERGETCNTCPPIQKPRPLQPCGTRAAYDRHTKENTPYCDPCRQARREYRKQTKRPPRENVNQTPTKDLLEEIRFLLNAGEGTARILQATGYAGREKALRDRLAKHGQTHLANRILNPWELAA
jgi:hypothetical protein